MLSTLSNPEQTPTVPLPISHSSQQQEQGQHQHLRQQRHLQWPPIAIAPTATGAVTGAITGRVSTAATAAATSATFASAVASGAIEYPDPVVLVPVPTSPLGENELAFVFNANNNNNTSSTCTTSTTSTAAAVGVVTGSGNDIGGIKRGHDEPLEQELGQVGAEPRQAKRARVMMGSLSHLTDDEVKRMRRVKNRESVEKCRTKQRLRMEALQIEQTCLKSENQMLRATVMQIERLVSAFNKSSANRDGQCHSDVGKNKDNKMKSGDSGSGSGAVPRSEPK